MNLEPYWAIHIGATNHEEVRPDYRIQHGRLPSLPCWRTIVIKKAKDLA